MMTDFYQRPFPRLSLGNGFILREQSLEDTETFFSYYSNPEVGQYILATKPATPADACGEIHYCRNLFYQRRGAYWSIAHEETNQMVGAIGLYINNQHHRAEICYDLNQDYWGQGIMSRAVLTVTEFAFNQIGVERMEALTMKENTASNTVLQKTGFIREGTLHNYRFFQGKMYDVELFGLTPDRFANHIAKQSTDDMTVAV